MATICESSARFQLKMSEIVGPIIINIDGNSSD
jgi:hypothetical protein